MKVSGKPTAESDRQPEPISTTVFPLRSLKENMNTQSEQEYTATTLALPLPVRDGGLFKHGATSDILDLLAQSPLRSYTHRELARRTGDSINSIRSAVDVLEANDLVTVQQNGNAQPVTINSRRLDHSDHPVAAVPQSEFHWPIQTAVETLKQELAGLQGIVLFGSVARGSADRRSDIDLWVLVESDRLAAQQAATRLAADLSEVRFPTEPVPARELPPDNTVSLEALAEIDTGDRFEFELLVETPTSIRNRADDRIEEILTAGIVLYRTEALTTVIEEVPANAN